MAEILAFGKDEKNMKLTSVVANADGSKNLQFEGNGFKPEVRLAAAEAEEVDNAVPAKGAPPAEKPAPPSTTSFGGYSAQNPMPAGTTPYAASSPWNQKIPVGAEPIVGSAAMVSYMLGLGSPAPANLVTGGEYCHPIYYAKTTDPVVTIVCKSGVGAAEINGKKIPCPAGAIPAPGSDGHMDIVVPNGDEYCLWQAKHNGNTIECNGGGINSFLGSGVGTGATAANFALAGGVIRAPELIAGVIPHKLFVVVKETRKEHFKAPATHTDGQTTNANAPEQGQELAYEMTSAEIAELNVPVWKKTVLTCLATFGALVGDSGGAGVDFQFEAAQSQTAFGLPDPFAAYAKQIGLSAFDGEYAFNLASGIDWTRLRAIA